ncbi:MAG TPA: M20 family peptidase [Candidatus Acidoferrales bacterium]|nr:M20 family peptidase [Candidatus Acidoferrales bacterium]
MTRLLRWVALLFLLLIVVVGVKTLLFRSRQVEVAPAKLAKLDSNAVAERFAAALRFRTVSNQDTSLTDTAQFRALHDYLTEKFPLVHSKLKRETVNDLSLLYTWPGRDSTRKPILLLSHIDVVPVEPGTEDRWEHPPFDGVIADGFIWGRGALDDKYGVLAILEAAEMLLRDGFQPAATIYFAFGHDEEVGGPNGASKIAELLASRGIHPEFVLDEGGSLIQGAVPGLGPPAALIGIAEKGSVSVELVAHVEGGHSSSPPEHTAVGVVSTAVHELERHPLPGSIKGALRLLLDRVGPEMSLPYRVAMANLWLTGPLVERLFSQQPAANASLRTTTAATMISGGVKENVLPASARAVVNFRILPGDTINSVVEHVRQVVNDPRVEIRALDGAREATEQSPIDTPSFLQLERTIRSVYPGTVVTPFLTIGGTDARHYENICRNVYRFTPIVGDRSDLARLHGTNERTSVAHYAQAIQFFVELIRSQQNG